MSDIRDPELDDLIGRISAPSAPMEPPMPEEPPGMADPPDNVVQFPKRSRWVVGLAAAAGLLLAVGIGRQALNPSGQLTRGGETTTAASTVDLQLATLSGGTSARLNTGDVVSVGEAILFQVSASPAADVVLTVDGPGGVETIQSIQAGPTPQTLTLGEQALAYIVEAPGPHRFTATPTGGAAVAVTVTAE